MPALFVGHGSPLNTLERNGYTDAWRQLGEKSARAEGFSGHFRALVLATTSPQWVRTHREGVLPLLAESRATTFGAQAWRMRRGR